MTSCLLSYPISKLSQFDDVLLVEYYLLVEFLLSVSVFCYSCIISEVLEWANRRIRRSIYASNWYEMCPEAQRMMLMFLRRTQGHSNFGRNTYSGKRSFCKISENDLLVHTICQSC
uniref:Uncharacterized protein n=1 Tax=Cacopsylla melanoneura TaxID=428564 RepID=A0A8D9AHM8_9HEMI